MPLIIDAHLDLAWNALSYDRDQTLELPELRAREREMSGNDRGRNTVSIPEMRKGQVAICAPTVLARSRPEATLDPLPKRTDLDYVNQDAASAVAQGQLAYYRRLEARSLLRQITDRQSLDEVWSSWQSAPQTAPIGYILSMEGADPIAEPEQAEFWWEQGLRTVMLAHFGPGAYAMGTGLEGPLTVHGRRLLRELDRLGMILDLSHACDTSHAEALEMFAGPVMASHSNCRTLVPGNRQLSDEQIHVLAARGGVIGVVMHSPMLVPGLDRDRPQDANVSLNDVVDHIDHICQLVGNARQVGIGSDLDGGFGAQWTPREVDSIADLQQLAPALSRRGYKDQDIDAIFHGNWLRFFRESLPRRT